MSVRVFQRTLLTFLACVVAFCSPSHAGVWCPAEGAWVDNCSSPTIRITGLNEFLDTVSISGGTITITVANAATYALDAGGQPYVVIGIQGIGVEKNITSLTVTGAISGFNNALDFTASLSFGGVGGGSIGDLADVDFGGQFDGMSLAGAITGDLGPVRATQIEPLQTTGQFFEVGGDVVGDIDLVSGVLAKPAEQMGVLRVLGDIHGGVNIRTYLGGILTIDCFGSIGEYDATSEVRSKVAIKTTTDLGSIFAGEIHADILPGDLGSSKGDVFIVETLTARGSGDFSGIIDAKALAYASSPANARIHIGGDLGVVGHTTTIEFAEPVEQPIPVRVGGSFRAGSAIDLPANGLLGSILFNAEDASGVWESGGVITVGSTTLTQAIYSTLPSAVGGGVAGLPDSGYFGAACNPGANTIVSLWPVTYPGDCETPPSFSGGIVHSDLRFRTAVEADSDGFTILRTELGASFIYATDVTSQYTWAPVSGDESESTVRFTRTAGGDAFLTGYEYRIIPVSEKVRVKYATGTPDVNMSYYQFGVQWSCDLGLLANFDLNQDESLCSQDIAAWMNDPVDFDDDEVADSTDLGYLVNGVSVWQNR